MQDHLIGFLFSAYMILLNLYCPVYCPEVAFGNSGDYFWQESGNFRYLTTSFQAVSSLYCTLLSLLYCQIEDYESYWRCPLSLSQGFESDYQLFLQMNHETVL